MKRSFIISFLIIQLISCAAPYTAVFDDVEIAEAIPEKVEQPIETNEMTNVQQQKADLLKKQFRPPAWILGTWTYDEAFISFEFKERDVLSLFGGFNSSFKDTYQDYISNSSSSDHEYTFTISVGGMVQTYRFVKRSANSIDYYLITNGNDSGAIQLMKK